MGILNDSIGTLRAFLGSSSPHQGFREEQKADKGCKEKDLKISKGQLLEKDATKCAAKDAHAHDVVGTFASLLYWKKLREVKPKNEHDAGIAESHSPLYHRLHLRTPDQYE